MKDIKKSFTSRKFKMGAYQTLVMVIVIVLVIVLNLVVNKMNITEDLSSDQKFTLTEETKKLAGGIKDKITMYYMCQDGSEQVQIEKVLDQYDGLGTITVVDKDPVIYPNFSKEYTQDEIQSNDVIVVNETNKKSKVVSAADMLIQDMDYTTYQQVYTLDAEGQLTAALQNVTSQASVKMYCTSGHNETQMSASFTDILTKSNIDYEELATASVTAIPEDCKILLINSPQYDFSDDEYKLISEYLKNGGKAMFFLNAVAADKMENYHKLLSDYGVNVVDGFVLDTQASLNETYPMLLVPLAEEHEITADVTDRTQVVLPTSKGMTTQSDVRSTLSVTSFLQTSEAAFAKVDPNSQTLEKEEKDIAGPFSVGLDIKDTYTENTKGSGNATEIVVFGSGNFIASDFIDTNQYANRQMVLNTLTLLSGTKTNTLAVPTRSLSDETVMIQEGDRIFFTVLLVVIVPLILLVTGFVIWFRRRKS